jgi:hypothetical protein
VGVLSSAENMSKNVHNDVEHSKFVILLGDHACVAMTKRGVLRLNGDKRGCMGDAGEM